MSANAFDESWKKKVEARRARQSRFPAPKKKTRKFGYVYLMSNGRHHLLKVGYTTRRSNFEVGRIAQHLSNGFEKICVVRLESRDEAQQLEKDILSLWTKFNVRRRVSLKEMPQGGFSEVAEDCDLARKLFFRAVKAKKAGHNPREMVLPPALRATSKSNGGMVAASSRSALVAEIALHLIGVQILPVGNSDGIRSSKSSPALSKGRVAFDESEIGICQFPVSSPKGIVGYIPREVAVKLRRYFQELEGDIGVEFGPGGTIQRVRG